MAQQSGAALSALGAARDAGILEVLAERARASSDTRLAADAAGGLVVALALALWRGPGWYFLLAIALCFCAFGVWGISDRERREQAAAGKPVPAALRGIGVVSAVVGLASVVFLIMVVLAKALGTIIS